MSTLFLDPASDGTIDTSGWFPLGGGAVPPAFSKINQGVRSPSTPSTSVGISCQPGNNADKDAAIVMGTTSSIGSGIVTQIDIYQYGDNFSGTVIVATATITPVGGSPTSAQTFSLGGSAAWSSVSFTGLTWTQSQVSGFTVTLIGSGKNKEWDLFEMYAVVTYGSGTTIVNGVTLPANGISTAAEFNTAFLLRMVNQQ